MEKSSISLHSLYVERPVFFKHDFKKTTGLIFLQRSWEWSLKKNKIKTFPPQGFGSHQNLVSGIHSSPIKCQKSQAFPPFPTRALRLTWNYSTHEARPVQQPLHKASHHSVSNSLTQVHTHAANPSANPSVSSLPLSLLIQTWQSGVSPSSLYLFLCWCFHSALPGGGTRCSAADCSCWRWSTAWHLRPLQKTNCTRRGRENWVRNKFFGFFFLWKSSPVNNNNKNDILLSFLINPQPSSFGWKSSGFPVRKRPQTNIVLRVILTYSCQVDVLCTTVTVGCQSTTTFRHSAKLTATKNTSVNCESARAATCFLPQLVFIHPACLHFSLLWCSLMIY